MAGVIIEGGKLETRHCPGSCYPYMPANASRGVIHEKE
jgi:hypothetical protein